MGWLKDAYKWLRGKEGSGDTVSDDLNNQVYKDQPSNSWNEGEYKTITETLNQAPFDPLDLGYWSLLLTSLYKGFGIGGRNDQGSKSSNDENLLLIVLGLVIVVLFWFLDDRGKR